MATFERKVSEIFYEHPRLVRKTPVLIRQLFQESEAEFKRRLEKEAEDKPSHAIVKLFDILFIDFYFDEIEDWFLNWVIKNYAERFNENELEAMRAQTMSHLDFYEVLEVFPGEGSRIKSLYTENEYLLKDVSSSTALTKWDIALIRRYSMGNISYVTGSLSLFRALDRRHILEKLEEAHEKYIKLFQEENYSDFAKNRWDVFIQIERELHERYEKKAFFTNYGEYQFCEVRFQVNNLSTMLKKIGELEEFNFLKEKIKKDKKKRQHVRYDFDWLTLGIEQALSKIHTPYPEDGIVLTTHQLDVHGKQMGIEVVGTFYVDKYLARLETRSSELAEFARDHFVSVFGQTLTFKRIIKKDMEKVLKKGKKTDQTKSAEEVNPLIQDVAMNELYMGILDKKVPALNHMTPREARNDFQMLPLLISWLKEIENMEEKKKRLGERHYSVDKLKKELNIDF